MSIFVYVGVLDAGFKRYLFSAENVNIGVRTRACVEKERVCMCGLCPRTIQPMQTNEKHMLNTNCTFD